MTLKTLTETITNQAGAPGAAWIDSLPALCQTLCEEWQLFDLTPVDNMTWHYVAKASQASDRLVVLKIGYDRAYIADEVSAYAHFNGHAAVDLIDYHDAYNAILLSQAVPGHALKSLYPEALSQVVSYYADVVNQLCLLPQPRHHGFKHCRDWLGGIDVAGNAALPAALLKRAKALKNKLLATCDNEIILHGDLHHDNIINHQEKWLVIDPRGIVGEKAFEAALFDFVTDRELKELGAVAPLFQSRLSLLSNRLNVDVNRLKEWAFVRMVLGACWMVEDNGDPSLFIARAKAIESC